LCQACDVELLVTLSLEWQSQHEFGMAESTEGGGANEKHSALHDGLNCVAEK